jgi:hypothetical protein
MAITSIGRRRRRALVLIMITLKNSQLLYISHLEYYIIAIQFIATYNQRIMMHINEVVLKHPFL